MSPFTVSVTLIALSQLLCYMGITSIFNIAISVMLTQTLTVNGPLIVLFYFVLTCLPFLNVSVDTMFQTLYMSTPCKYFNSQMRHCALSVPMFLFTAQLTCLGLFC